MVLFLCFLFAALLCFLFCTFFLQTGLPTALGLSVGVFLLLHILYMLFFWLVSLTIPNDRPLKKQSSLCRFAIMTYASILDFYCGVHPVVTGVEKLPADSRFLFVCNHRSMFDPIIVADCLRRWNLAFVSKPSNMNIPFTSRVAYGAGYLPLDRENNRNALKTILTAADYMKRGLCSMAIYPEGTRSRTGELLPFHAGSFKVAQKAGVPIVAACVHGTERVQKFRFFTHTTVYLDILDVIPAEEVRALRTDELSNRVRSLIRQKLDSVSAGSGSDQYSSESEPALQDTSAVSPEYPASAEKEA